MPRSSSTTSILSDRSRVALALLPEEVKEGNRRSPRLNHPVNTSWSAGSSQLRVMRGIIKAGNINVSLSSFS